MSRFRDRIENLFVSFGHLICRHRWLTLALTLAFAALLLSQLPKTRFDTSAEGLLHPDDPALVVFDEFREQFGSDQMIIAMLEPPEVFDLKFLTRLKAFHEELETLDNVDKVESLINATRVYGTEDEIIIEDLLEEWPEDEQDLAALRDLTLSNPLYLNAIISKDGNFTTVTVRPVRYASATAESGFEDPETSETESGLRKLNEIETKQLLDQVQAVSDRYQASDFPIHLGGTITAEESLKELTRDTMVKFTFITALIIMVILGLLFRRLAGVILPLIVIYLTLYCTLGLMAGLGVPFTLNTTVMPSLLLAVGVGDAVHLLTVFYLRFKKPEDKEDAIAFALGHSGLAVLMTSLTTAAGLMSFVSAGIAPVADLGIFCAIGVMLALFFSIVLLPVMLVILPIKPRAVKDESSFSRLDNLLIGIGDFAVRHPGKIVVGGCVVLCLSLYLALQLTFTHNSLIYFKKHNPVRQAIELIDREMNGSLTIEIMIDTGEENGLYDPIIMQTLERMNRHAEQLEIGEHRPGKSSSLVDFVKEMNSALYADEPGYYTVPDDRQLIAQELLLFTNSDADDLERLVDTQFSKARMTILVPWVDAVLYADLLQELEVDFNEMLAGRAKVTVTGMTAIICRTFAEIIRTMGTSYLIAAGVITLFMIVLIGDVRMGLVSMAPNLLPIILGLGFMKIVGVPLDYSTIMVGGIAIGLAVDDTVHYFHNFRRYYDKTGDPKAAVHQTMQTTGRALLFTTIILSGAFFNLLAADMNSTVNFGLITGFTITMALLADFLLAPALLVLLIGKARD
ncbi:RND family transporter [Thermodesulfobacteriota bacterium]